MKTDFESGRNPSADDPVPKPKVVVIMGATGSGKSRLAIDLASHFPIEIINADSMQVYKGLDVLTNKVPLQDQKGVPHHLLGTISPNDEFTARNFRDYVIPLISDITSRNHLPVIVGGTNYYIQALVSRFLQDDPLQDMNECCSGDSVGDQYLDAQLLSANGDYSLTHESLKELDPVAANRIHPNDHRKISQYLCLYARSGILPSKYLQEKTMENWANADNFRYDCCFICVDASLPVIDKYVEKRVEQMVDDGLLTEVYDIYKPNADYTRGLRQAIGVREFEDFIRVYRSDNRHCTKDDPTGSLNFHLATAEYEEGLKESMCAILHSSDENQLKFLLHDAIDKVKANTQRLVRRQKRRIIRLRTLFGWNIHYVDATDPLLSLSDTSWITNIVDPSIQIIKSFLNDNASSVSDLEARDGSRVTKLEQRDLWSQYVCKACGDKVLRGAYEWEQHQQGRSHRKRVCSLRKSGMFDFK